MRTRRTAPKGASLEERLLFHSVRQGDCLIWTGAVNKYGYGVITVDGKAAKAHRIAFVTWNGPLLNGTLVRHTCDRPPCIERTHLIPGTAAQNVRDTLDRRRATLQLAGYKPLTASDRARLKEMRTSGMSYQAIATATGWNLSTVWDHVNDKLGASLDVADHAVVPTFDNRHRLRKQHQLIWDRSKAGQFLQRELAVEFGVSTATVSLVLSGRSRFVDYS